MFLTSDHRFPPKVEVGIGNELQVDFGKFEGGAKGKPWETVEIFWRELILLDGELSKVFEDVGCGKRLMMRNVKYHSRCNRRVFRIKYLGEGRRAKDIFRRNRAW